MHTHEYSITVGEKTVTAEFSDLADQADGSVLIRCGNSAVLVTAVMDKRPADGDFFPLTVDYEERFYAAGAILGSRYMRREGKPSEEATLSARLIDRTIRPLFDTHLRTPTQIVVMVLSIDEEDPDMLAVIGASLALGTSDIPWNGPVSAVRVGSTDERGAFVINPTYEFRNQDQFHTDLVVCGQRGRVTMIETGAHEASEAHLEKGIGVALKEIERLEEWQRRIITEIGHDKRIIEPEPVPDEIVVLFEKHIAPDLDSYVFSGQPGKATLSAVERLWEATLADYAPDANRARAMAYLEDKINEAIHIGAIKHDKRPDGRAMDEVRPLFAQAGGISPIHHGTGIFYRGGTHILTALTLGGPGDSQLLEGMETRGDKRFIHHYNFPPFSVGETGRMGGANRRMIGHGALAEKALEPVIPSKDTFPYTIRLVSEALASNGSTSMGSVCASSLALMDGGVPIAKPVAGIASGLLMHSDREYKVLTDIQGPEDHHGDMDFKVAGTRDGVTAVQMDVTVNGVTPEILSEAFARAKEARERILDVIEAELAAPREKTSPNAPYIQTISIPTGKIRDLIGPGGKVVTDLRERTLTEIDIEDDGTVVITGKADGVEQAIRDIEEITRVYEVGQRYNGTVATLKEFGAFVTLGNGTDGLLHISEIAPYRIEKVEDVLTVGQNVPVVIKEIDDRGRLKLSLKAVDPDFIKNTKKS
ncbi:MAG: polyribonucleotide nucleotidyltransferase [Candidatus Paceibacterota bacterium]